LNLNKRNNNKLQKLLPKYKRKHAINPYHQDIILNLPKKHHQEKSLAFIAPIDKSCIHHDKKKRDSELSKRAKISIQEVSLSSDEFSISLSQQIFLTFDHH
jgi:hypothetical protein